MPGPVRTPPFPPREAPAVADNDSVRESIVIDAEPASVYDTIGDFERYPEWLTEFKTVEVTQVRDDGWAQQARYTLGAVGITLSFVLDYTYTDDRIEWTLVEGDMLQRLDGAYDLTDNGDGTTTLTYELEVTSSIPLPGFVRRKVAAKIVSDSLAAAKQRAEAEAAR